MIWYFIKMNLKNWFSSRFWSLKLKKLSLDEKSHSRSRRLWWEELVRMVMMIVMMVRRISIFQLIMLITFYQAGGSCQRMTAWTWRWTRTSSTKFLSASSETPKFPVFVKLIIAFSYFSMFFKLLYVFSWFYGSMPHSGTCNTVDRLFRTRSL